MAARFVAICLGTLLAARAWAQEPERREVRPAFDRNERCLNCHADLKSGTDFVANFAAKTWQEEDKHRRAMTVLEEQAELTARILGFPLSDVVVEGELREGAEAEKRGAVEKCMRCHATWPRGHVTPPVELRAGVSCQACHGPGFHWSRPHEEKWWRLCAVDEKERLGQRNVRSASVKAALCASCHVGSAEEDRFVTHAMYAAGHPPLPGFELAAFMSQMPAHWRPLAEKGDFAGTARNPYRLTAQDRATLAQLPVRPDALRADFHAAHFPDFEHAPASDVATPRDVLAGGVAVLSRYVELWEAASRGDDSGAGAPWPDFALFDCRACHHELQAEGSRTVDSRFRRRTPPGRPPAPLWPTILARAADRYFIPASDGPGGASESSFDRRLRQFDEAITARPFGDSRKVAEASRELRVELDRLAVRVERGRYDERAAERVATWLTADAPTVAGPRPSDDYDAARQTAWSIELLLARRKADASNRALRDVPPNYFVSESFADPLRLRLPAGPSASVIGARRDAFEAPERFDSDWFRSRLDALKTKKSPAKD